MPSVPWLFLFASAVGALFTLNAHLPPSRSRWLAGAGFFPAWLTAELAAHHLAWQLVATGLFVYAGALHAWPGWLGLGLTVASWAGLVRAWQLARDTEQVLERALTEALGAEHRAELSDETRGQLEEGLSTRERLLPIPPVIHGPVRRVRDLPYVPDGGPRQRLDVYYAPRAGAAAARARPVLLFVHGGAWVLSRKEEQGLPLLQRLAAHGWVCVTTNYRLSPKATFPDAIVDVKAALRWVRAHCAEYGGDPSFIAIAGGSAGGHLAALAALTADERAWQPGFEEADTRVAACVSFYGVYDFTDRHGHWAHSRLRGLLERAVFKKNFADARDEFERASPMSRVHAAAPPFFVLHGTHDTLVPVEDARHFVRALEAQRVPVAYAELPGAEHAFEVFPSERALHVLRAVEAFLAVLFARHRARSEAGTEGLGDARSARE